MNWQPAFETTEQTIVGVTDDQPIHPERVEQWRQFPSGYPSILVTQTGWVVDGRHRLAAARADDDILWGQIVKHIGKHWVATGNTVRVL